ncbi:MAG: HAD-IA family hydrolase [Burkholderiales bacterium]|nr:HAD-IA family hydrolase [Burkholderiales bacterium]
MTNETIRAVLWDFGGVLTDSPFDAFRDYERAHGLPRDFIRSLNARDPDANAWARFERSEIGLDEFDRAFAEEARIAGHAVHGRDVVKLLYGRIRPEMVQALRRCASVYRNACLTNNVNAGSGHGLPTSDQRAAEVAQVLAMFDVVIESRKVGVRKPDPQFYRLALETLRIEPQQAVYLDDLGINLKPARALGMHTIKVTDSASALAALEEVLDIPLR